MMRDKSWDELDASFARLWTASAVKLNRHISTEGRKHALDAAHKFAAERRGDVTPEQIVDVALEAYEKPMDYRELAAALLGGASIFTGIVLTFAVLAAAGFVAFEYLSRWWS